MPPKLRAMVAQEVLFADERTGLGHAHAPLRHHLHLVNPAQQRRRRGVVAQQVGVQRRRDHRPAAKAHHGCARRQPPLVREPARNGEPSDGAEKDGRGGVTHQLDMLLTGET